MKNKSLIDITYAYDGWNQAAKTEARQTLRAGQTSEGDDKSVKLCIVYK